MKTSMSVWGLTHVMLFVTLVLDLIAFMLLAYPMFRTSLPDGSRDGTN